MTEQIENKVTVSPLDMEDAAVLSYTQGIRKGMIDDMTALGVPDNNRDRRMLLEMLDSMDNNIFSAKRAEVEEQQVNNDEAAIAIINAIQDKVTRDAWSLPDGKPREVVVSEEYASDYELVPGHLDVGCCKMDYDAFVEKMDDK